MFILNKIIKRFSKIKIVFFLGDCIILYFAIFLTLSFEYRDHLYFTNPFYNIPKLLQFGLVQIITLISFRYLNLYKEKNFLTFNNQIIRIIKAVLFSSSILIVSTFFIKEPDLQISSRSHLIVFIVLSIVLVSIHRIILMRLYVKNKSEGIFDRRILAIGAGETGKRFVKEIKEFTSFFYLVGFLDEDKDKVGSEIEGVEVLGTGDDLSRIIREYRIEEIFITIEYVSHDKLLTLIEIAKDTKCQVNLVSSHFGIVEKKVDVVEYKDLKSVPVYSTMTPLYSMFTKRIIDILAAFIAIVILSPLFVVISILIKVTSKGSIFYKTHVIGKNGKSFVWYKFRTMKQDGDEKIHKEYLTELITENKPVEKIKDDPRITSAGKVLRKYSLDEFPQLLNVLRGDMSLIGPRPCLPYEYELMDAWHKRRTKVIPGLTGLWQVFGRNKADVSFNDSLILDIYYAENLSFWLDLRIFFKTVPVVIFGKGGS